jgi:hypothetical protein
MPKRRIPVLLYVHVDYIECELRVINYSTQYCSMAYELLKPHKLRYLSCVGGNLTIDKLWC